MSAESIYRELEPWQHDLDLAHDRPALERLIDSVEKTMLKNPIYDPLTNLSLQLTRGAALKRLGHARRTA